MSVKPLEISGGESFFCINESQLKKAVELAYENPQSSVRISRFLENIEAELSGNERAALAFVIVDRLLKNN